MVKGGADVRGLFTLSRRYGWIRRLEELEFDVVVIGGGIIGAGVALDAVTRDLRVLIVDMDDFASGTSSRSSKIVHGGLRYLTNLEFSYISQISKERGIVYENAPHVISPIQMALPIYKYSTHGTFATKVGLKIYDWLAQVRAKERSQEISKDMLYTLIPNLKKDGLYKALSYIEYQTEDARLTLEVIKEAIRNDACALNYMKAEEILQTSGRISGVRLKDMLTKKEYTVRTKSVVNAAGPWVKEVAGKLVSFPRDVHWLKGAHFVFSKKNFPLNRGVFFEGPDKRMMAAVPKKGSVYVGTTDDFVSPNEFNLYADVNDRLYILKALDYAFPNLNLSVEDIISSWAGVRTSLSNSKKDALNFIQKDEIYIGMEGLITVIGGTLTGYRRTAERVVDLLLKEEKLGIRTNQIHSLTYTQTLSGGYLNGIMSFEEFEKIQVHHAVNQGWSPEAAKYLIRKYAGNFDKILKYRNEYEDLRKNVEMPEHIFYSLVYGILEEMVITSMDFFARRTDWLYFQPELVQTYNERVCRVLQQFHNWTSVEMQRHREQVEKTLYFSTTELRTK